MHKSQELKVGLVKIVVKVKTQTCNSRDMDVYSPDTSFKTHINSNLGILDCDCDYPVRFDVRSTRYHRLLYFTACRLLGGHDGAEEAVRNCLIRASCNLPVFGSEGAFRSWLIRILIDEALLTLQERKNVPVIACKPDASENA